MHLILYAARSAAHFLLMRNDDETNTFKQYSAYVTETFIMHTEKTIFITLYESISISTCVSNEDVSFLQNFFIFQRNPLLGEYIFPNACHLFNPSEKYDLSNSTK